MQLDEACLYEMPFEFVRAHVKPVRDLSRDPALKQRWRLLKRPVPGLRKALTGLDRCIVTPEVSKHRILVWASTQVRADHTCHVIAREDDYFFGVLHSLVHETWSLRTGSTLEDRPRYNSDQLFSTFPFPWPPGTEPSEAEDPGFEKVKAIADAARELVRLRDAWLNPPDTPQEDLKKRTLTNLYNARPDWLANAHRALDEAVFAAYGWPSSLTTQQILSNLLALNHQRAAAQPTK